MFLNSYVKKNGTGPQDKIVNWSKAKFQGIRQEHAYGKNRVFYCCMSQSGTMTFIKTCINTSLDYKGYRSSLKREIRRAKRGA